VHGRSPWPPQWHYTYRICPIHWPSPTLTLEHLSTRSCSLLLSFYRHQIATERMRPLSDALPTLGSALVFIAGGLLGSITTQVLLPGASWESCQKLGVTAAARTSVPSSQAHAEAQPAAVSPDSSHCGAATKLVLPKDEACHATRANGTYNIKSPFTGPPTPEVDAAWERYWQTWIFSVDEAAFLTSQPQYPLAAVRLEGGSHHGRYLATFEATHQLHCLYNLFRASYLDSYPDEKADYDRDPRKWHERVDHCVEILRQKLEWCEFTYTDVKRGE